MASGITPGSARGLYMVPGVKLGSATCKANAVLFLWENEEDLFLDCKILQTVKKEPQAHRGVAGANSGHQTRFVQSLPYLLLPVTILPHL